MEARPPASACAAGAPLLMAKAGGKPAGRGISISPSLHPPLETTNQGGLGPPIGCTPQSCPTGSLPAAKAYFVTPSPLERHRKRPGLSAAWHRRRPGGPGRYNAAAVRACRVIDAGRPRRGSACHETKKGTGRGCTPGSCFVCTAFRRHEPPYWGVQGGRSPPALLSPHFFGKKWGRPPRRHPPGGWASIERATTGRPYSVGPSCGSFASA